jgi:hypothetical protein
MPPRKALDQLHLAVRLTINGPVAVREPLTEADLLDARSELWLACLRTGRAGMSLDEMQYGIVPMLQAGSRDRVLGFELVHQPAAGEGRLSVAFSRASLKPVAMRVLRRLQTAGIIGKQDCIYFELSAGPAVGTADDLSAPATRNCKRQTHALPVPLNCLSLPVSPLASRSLAVGQLDARVYPVFYTAAALAQAERCSRRGASLRPPVETGAVLVGPLCSCPKSGEFFSIVCAVMEVRDAEQTQFSLTLSGKSWEHIQCRIRELQSRPATVAFRVLGMAHGHPFAPKEAMSGDPQEEASPWRSHTAFVSNEDVSWSRAVFARQPWQLSHIFGQDRQGQPVDVLFGQRDCTLLPRCYYVLPEWSAEEIDDGAIVAREA